MITEIDFDTDEDPCPTIEWKRETTDDEFITGIEKLTSLCASYGIDVDFGYNNSCTHHSGQNKISMNNRFKPQRLFYVLLHETGHMVINKAMCRGKNHTEFLLNYPGNVDRNNKCYTAEGGRESKLSKKDQRRRMVTIVHEELDAWRKGIDIAAMLELPLDLYEYYSVATKGVESYIIGTVLEGNLQIT